MVIVLRDRIRMGCRVSSVNAGIVKLGHKDSIQATKGSIMVMAYPFFNAIQEVMRHLVDVYVSDSRA